MGKKTPSTPVLHTGIGISHELMETIFERFRQVDDSHRRYQEGSGLGLTISKALVEAHGGKMWIESVQGEGSTFYFTIPYSNYSDKKNEGKENNSIDKANNFKGRNIIITEDDSNNFLYLKEALEDVIKNIEIGLGANAFLFNSKECNIIKYQNEKFSGRHRTLFMARDHNSVLASTSPLKPKMKEIPNNSLIHINLSNLKIGFTRLEV